jgi:tetratricopeptide (TPR) repeat protein
MSEIDRLAELFPALARRYEAAIDDPFINARAAEALIEAQEPRVAVALLEGRLAHHRESAVIWGAAAYAYFVAGDHVRAIEALRTAVRLAPAVLRCRRVLAHQLVALTGETAEAASILAAIIADGGSARDYQQLAQCFLDGRTVGAVVEEMRRATATGDDRVLLRALAWALFERGRYEESAGVAGHLVRVDATDVEGWRALAWSLTRQGDRAEADRGFGRAIALDPDHRDTLWSRYMNLHALGADEEASAALRDSSWLNSLRRQYPKLWTGQPLDGKSVLLRLGGPVGFGDAVQMVRFAAVFHARGARVTVIANQPIRELFAHVAGVDRAITRFDDLDDADYDYECPLVELPVLLGASHGESTHAGPYLPADERRIRTWRWRLSGDSALAVGVACAAGVDPSAGPDLARCIPLVALDPLALLGNARLYNLQKSWTELRAWGERPTVPIHDAARDCAGFMDLSALLSVMDVVVTGDNGVAHVSAALGKPTFILLPHAADWKWGINGSLSRWYPTARLCRQSRSGSWRHAVADVMAHLGESLERRVQPAGC